VNAEEFEQRVLKIWVTTRIPLTRANVQYLTAVPRKKLDPWLRQLVVDGVLDADVDAAGEIVYTVRGADRSPGGAQTLAEYEKKDQLEREVRSGTGRAAGAATSAATALVLARETARGGPLVPSGEHKSLAVSGVLSFFFGPVGWLYAAPIKTAVPAAIGTLIALSILPRFLLLPFLLPLMAASGVAGALYAWKYNRSGKRVPILPDKDGG
jgi:hypothetical protein